MEFQELLKITSIESKNPSEQIDIIGILFDLAYDNSSLHGIEHGFNLSKQIDVDSLENELYTIFQYDLSNGWSSLRKIKYHQTKLDWNFQMEELTNEIFHLRKALSSPGFNTVQVIRQCQIYTNIGNCLSYIGRFVEAQQYWNNAISLFPKYSMSVGNKANGLFFYARALYDSIHRNLFAVFAYHYVKKALENPEYLHHEAAEGFQNLFKTLKNYLTQFPEEYAKEYPNLNNYDIGDDEDLRRYRRWCLDNTLYINPLNDLGSYTDACHDCLNLPTLILTAKRPPSILDLYNQIKQEFATARYAYYSSLLGTSTHISDIDVPLVETMETVKYSYYVEHIKIAFRLSYSILDKIAYLLNDYLQLQLAAHKVSFKSIWHTNDNKTLRSFFLTSENWALRGLYWLSKDLYEKGNNYDSVLEPDAKEVATIRNFIEHKGFKVMSDFRLYEPFFEESDISYSITRQDFEAKTLKLLKLTRAAIIYTALAVSHEEEKKDNSNIKAIPIGGRLIPQHMRL